MVSHKATDRLQPGLPRVPGPHLVGFGGVGQPNVAGHPVSGLGEARVEVEDLGVVGRAQRGEPEREIGRGAGDQVMPKIPVHDVTGPGREAERAR